MTAKELFRRFTYMLIPTFDQIGELRNIETLKVDILAGITVVVGAPAMWLFDRE